MSEKLGGKRGDRRSYLRGAPVYRLVTALLAVVATVVVVGQAPARAQAENLRVSLAVDQAEVVVDLSPGQSPSVPTLRYEIIVENLGDDLISGVEVVDELPAGLSHPAGSTLRMAVGDLGARAAWRDTVEATVQPDAVQGDQVANVVAVTTAAGDRIESAPAVTRVIRISATSIVAAPATTVAAPAPPATPVPAPRRAARPAAPRPTVAPTPAPQVLGAVFTRDAEGRIVADAPGAALARTGRHSLLLAGLGFTLVLAGTLLVRRVHT